MSSAQSGGSNATLPSSSSPSPAANGVVYIRRDGRTALEIRGKEMKLSEMVEFDGSSWYAQGQTAVMVSIHGPTLSKNEIYDTCLVRVRVHHARGLTPCAGGAERVVYDEMRLEALTRTDAFELTSLLESAIDAVFLKDRFPRCVLVVDVVVVQDDGSLAAVALNAVMCALLDAGVPCRTTMAAVSVAAVTRDAVEHKGPVTAAAESGKYFEFLLDPTRAEELLGAKCAAAGDSSSTAGGGGGDVSSAIAERADLGTSASTGNMSLLSRNAAEALQNQYRCVGTGVFVFSNPACGGGLLAQLVRGRGGRIESRSDDRNSGNVTSGVPLEAYAQMMALAERAAMLLFEFFRRCNVAE